MTRWYEVVGGGDKGGILVREGESLKSDAFQERLSTGALILVLEIVGERVRYKKHSGSGPVEGWVSRSLQGSPLLYETAPSYNGMKLLSHDDTIEAQKMLKESLSKAAVRKKIDELYNKIGHDQAKYCGMVLPPFLGLEVYPSLVKRFFGPNMDAAEGQKRLFHSMQYHSLDELREGKPGQVGDYADINMLQTWLEIEELMHNMSNIDIAKGAIEELQRRNRAVVPVKAPDPLPRDAESAPLPEGILSYNVANEAQKMLKDSLSSATMQDRIGELHRQFGRDQTKHSAKLMAFLGSEVYPNIVQQVLPGTAALKGMRQMLDSFQYHSFERAKAGDFEMIQRWLDMEILMRNEAQIDAAKKALGMLQQEEHQPINDEPSNEEQSEFVGADGCEVYSLQGKAIGVIFRGRAYAGCAEVGCKQFYPSEGRSRFCANCSKPSYAHEDVGTAVSALGKPVIRVKCLNVPKSSLDVLHVELQEGGTVQELQKALLARSLIPARATFFENGRRMDAREVAPLEVSVSELSKVVNGGDALLKVQARQAQDMIAAALDKPEIQQALDQMEQESAGNQVQYRKKLFAFLAETVYPDIVSHFGLPSTNGGTHLANAISQHSMGDICMMESWLVLEIKMRNESNVKRAEQAIESMLDATTTPAMGA